MSKAEMTDVAAIVTTLAEISPAPASSVYMALGCDHARYERATYLCAAAGLIEKTADALRITSKGLEIAAKLNAALA